MTWAEAIPLWITIAIAVAAVLYFNRHGGGAALEELERANGILEGRVKDLEQQNEQQAAEIVALKTKTDISLAIMPVLDALKLHEERAAQRSERTLDVLGLIADRLGPEQQAA